MISPALQEEIAAAVCPDAVVQAHSTMGVVGIEPGRREYWRVWVYAPDKPRLRLFLVMLRSNDERGFTFDVQYVFDVVAVHAPCERYSVTIEREVRRLLCNYGRWIGKPSFCINEVSVPIHPLFEAPDRLWSVQATFQEKDQDEPEARLPTLVWLHDGAIYLVRGESPLLETILFPESLFLSLCDRPGQDVLFNPH